MGEWQYPKNGNLSSIGQALWKQFNTIYVLEVF